MVPIGGAPRRWPCSTSACSSRYSSAAVYRLPGGVAAAAGGLQPLLVCVLSWPLAGRRPRTAELAVACVALLGVALVAIRPGANLDAGGLLAAAAANVSFAIGVVLTRRYPAPPSRLAATGWQLLMGGAILLPLTAVFEGAPPALTGRNLAGFAYLSIVGTALAFMVWFNGIRRLPPAAPPLLGLAAPITGAVLGWVVLGQSLEPLQLIGFAITIGAIAYGASLRSVAVVDRRSWNASARATVVATRRKEKTWLLPFVSGSIRSVPGAGPRRNGYDASPTRKTSRSHGSRSACS